MPRSFLPSFLFFSLLSLFPLSTRAQTWLDDVEPLIAPGEREAFGQLAGEAERQEFIRQFWKVRDPYPQTGRNELQESWGPRLAEARKRWGGLDDPRSRALLLRGEPGETFEASCPTAPGTPVHEVWVYEAGFGVKQRSVLVFRRDGGRATLWTPGPDAPALRPTNPEECANGLRLAQEAAWIRTFGEEQYAALLERTFARPRANPRDWYKQLAQLATATPQATSQDGGLQAGLDVEYPASVAESSVVRVRMKVPSRSLAALPAAGGPGGAHELMLHGQVLQERGVLEDFRYSFHVDPRVASEPFIPLVFERYLRPGLYRLRVRLVDLFTKRSFLDERELAVPVVDGSTPASAPAAAPEPGMAALYAEADAALAARPGVRLLPPPGEVHSGSTRIEARVDGAVSRVAFLLDGLRIYTRTRPPYAVTLDLGSVPRVQKLAVEGMNEAGEVVDRDELVLNAGAQRFAVRLVDPQPGRAYRSSLRARVEVAPPAGERVERVELFFNEDRVATLYQPPYTQPILLPRGKEVGYVRAVAYLGDGRAAEDLVLLNTPHAPDRMAVRLVELFTSVVDPGGRPVQSLDPRGFAVYEDGVAQEVRIAEPVGETPIRVVTLIDNSLSMRESLAETRQAALQFLRRTLRPADQAGVITFNRVPRVAVRLTSDLAELEEGLAGLLAEDQTSLYDSLAFALQYLGGVKGQRAVLLLSDGMDRTSRLTFEQTVECARRAGIAVYTIGLALADGGRGEAGEKLERLARETGGRSFFVDGTAGLDGVYGQIERDLRSQYRIAYQSTNNRTDDRFRVVKVEVAGKGMEARTISGYYP